MLTPEVTFAVRGAADPRTPELWVRFKCVLCGNIMEVGYGCRADCKRRTMSVREDNPAQYLLPVIARWDDSSLSPEEAARVEVILCEVRNREPSTYSNLLRYLAATAGIGATPAEVEAVHELAPDVYVVEDKYKGRSDIDVYFRADVEVDLDAARDFKVDIKEHPAWGLRCVAGGPLGMVERVKRCLRVTWHKEPIRR